MKILHLSDIHFGRNYARTKITDPFEKRDEIMDGLLSCIGSIPEGQKPEHIVVTGDIAWFGKRDEYEEAKAWFLRLLEVTGLTGKDLTFCVGNHDVNWSYGQIIDELTDETIAAIDAAYEYRNICDYEAPIQEYEQFCQDLGVEPYKYYVDGKVEYSYSAGYKDVTFSYGNVVRLVGFNTSLLSYGKKISEDKMWIGQPQIFDLMDYGILPKSEGCKYSIALMHHAEKFLHLNELCEYDGREATLPLLMKNVDLVLCGHTETGGVPVLKTQEGGGKILSAGATYYNDEHPNSFSIIYITYAGDQMFFDLYMYDGMWKRYQKNNAIRPIKQVKEVPPVGDVKEKCSFVVTADNQTYSIPMRVITVSEECDGKVSWCYLENNKEVSRKLKIECKVATSGGKAVANVTVPRKKERDSSSMLELEKYVKFLKEVVRYAKDTAFYIKSESGHIILQGDTMNVNEDNSDNEDGISILEKIVKIEDFFGVRLVRPDEVWEADLPKIDFLIALIECGYVEKNLPSHMISTNTNDCQWMKERYADACAGKACSMWHQGNYEVNLYGKKIPIYGLKIFIEKFEIDAEDLQYKIETYREGDARNINFRAVDNSKMYYVLNKEDFEEKMLDSECVIINVLHTGVQTDFISEIE